MNPSVAEKEWTVGELLNWTAQFLAQKGVESPRVDTEVLLARTLECRRIDLYGLRFAEVASDEVRQQFRDLVRQRLEGCPVAYLVGKKEFFKLDFEVGPAVLIPRPDTELVVTECLALARKLDRPRLLDIGTGSGNLAVALAYNLPRAAVTAIDLSPAALDLARRNAEKHGVGERIRFLQGDLLEPLSAGETFDFIVSNPPYIPHGDIPGLAVGVRDYEPHLALDGGQDGYEVFERLIRAARAYLAEGGQLLIEIGSPQEIPARQYIKACGCYQLYPTIYDYAGHPRVLQALYQQS